MGTQPPPQKGAEASPSIFGPCLLSPNSGIDQDATWYGGTPRPWRHCARWGPSFPPQKGGTPPIFGPCLLWPNGWMDEDATWYAGRPAPRPLLDANPAPKRGNSSQNPNFGEKVGFGPGHNVTWGPSSPPPQKKGGTYPNFRPCLFWPNGPISATAEHLF